VKPLAFSASGPDSGTDVVPRRDRSAHAWRRLTSVERLRPWRTAPDRRRAGRDPACPPPCHPGEGARDRGHRSDPL